MKVTKRSRADRLASEGARHRRPARSNPCRLCLRTDTELDKSDICTDRKTCELLAPPLFHLP